MPLLLGLTGNIACGKSTVGRLLAERYGAEYVDTDALVHALYAPGTPETAAIAARFGTDLLDASGTIDRRRLGDLVMADPSARADLEGILGPSVMRDLEQRIRASAAEVLVIDAIRLFEAGLAERCAAVWVVVCDRADQVARLVASRGLSEAQATLRVDAQGPQAEKIRRADVVIQNPASGGNLDSLVEQVDAAWRRTVTTPLKRHTGDTRIAPLAGRGPGSTKKG